MTVLAKLYKNSGQLELLSGEIDERSPVVRDGMVVHYPFDGSTKSLVDINSIQIDVLSNGSTSQVIMKNSLENGSIASGTMTIGNDASVAEALTHDLVVCDRYVWSIGSPRMAQLKEFADAGCTVWCSGNDTGSNVFVQSVHTFGKTETTTHGTTFDSVEAYLGPKTNSLRVSNNSADPTLAIIEFNEGLRIIPLYYHSFIGPTGIMGYLYLPNNRNGGSLFFDEFGYVTEYTDNQIWLKHLLNWQLSLRNVTKPLVADNHTTKYFDGIMIEEHTTNLGSDHDHVYRTYVFRSISDCTTLEPLAETCPITGGMVLRLTISTVSPSTNINHHWGCVNYFNVGSSVNQRTFTGSVWVRGPAGAICCIQLHSGEWLPGSTRAENLTLSGEWERLSVSHKFNHASCNHVVEFRISIYGNNTWDDPSNIGKYIDFSSVQFEEKPFPTSFTNSSRENGQLIIPAKFGEAGTISFNVVKSGYSTVGTSTNGAFISCNSDSFYIYANSALNIYAVNGGGSIANRIEKVSAISNHVSYHIAVTWNKTKLELFLDGESCGMFSDFGYSCLQNQDLYLGCESTHGRIGNVKISDLSIYNRALSPAEVKKLAHSKLSLRSTGEFIMDINEDEQPNLWPNTGFDVPYQVKHPDSSDPLPLFVSDSDGAYHTLTLLNKTWHYYGYDIPTENGETYIFSGLFWIAEGNTFTHRPLAIEGAISGSVKSKHSLWNTLPKEQWVFCWASCIADDTVRFLIYPCHSVAGSGTVKWKNISVHKASKTFNLNQPELLTEE